MDIFNIFNSPSVFNVFRKSAYSESHTFGNRELHIIFEEDVEPSIRFLFISTVAHIFETDKLAKKIPYLTVIFAKDDENIKGVESWGAYYSSEGEFIKVKTESYIESAKISYARAAAQLSTMFSHEVVHAWHNIQGRLDKDDYVRFRLITMKKKIDDELKYYAIHDIRQKLVTFMSKLQQEGLAQFYEAYSTFGYTDDLKTSYIESKNMAEALRNHFYSFVRDIRNSRNENEIIESNKRFSENFKQNFMTPGSGVYILGYHMVLLLIEDRKQNFVETLTKLADMNYLRFVKEYEKAARRNNMIPIISVTSGNGILDYKDMVREWMLAVKENSKA